MRKLALALVLLLAELGLAAAQSAIVGWTPTGFQQLILVGSIAPTVPQGTRMAVMCAETQAVRWRDDGTPPTPTNGMLIAAGTCYVYSGNFAALQVAQAASGAIVNITYYK